MASLVKQGRFWYVKYYPSGGQQKWVKGYTDKAETQRLAHRLEDEKTRIMRGEIDPILEQRKVERGKSIAHHVAAYETHLRAADRSKNHVSYTVGDIRAFVAPSGISNVSQITRSQVDEWVLKLAQQNELYQLWAVKPADTRGERQGALNSPKTINRRVGSVQSFLKWCQSTGAVSDYVLHRYPKRPTRGAAVRACRALTEEEVKKLLTWCQKNCPDRHDLYQFALFSGLRSHECASMAPASFDLNRENLTVHSKDTRNSDRVDTVPLHPKLLAVLKTRCAGKPPNEPLFHVPDHAAEKLQADCQAAGVDPTEVSFQGLRHTFITRLAQKGVHPKVTMVLARHRDLAMTLGYYSHWTTDDEKAGLCLLT